ncbi:hypothetical protein [Sediminitomix flava]|uniref:Uncharacterized protein n=1 Tax=Sediminitomix flava TaxID=379075 RepID=A0A315YQ79_SEDFL|nr:hypothetical protein [Sediminitomix flava]PWJ30594.1 hypothetical protein BC781_1271 [Sediminitomix flava]
MRFILIFISLLIFNDSEVFAQKPEGLYIDSFGSKIYFASDTTFKYEWNFDLASSWSIGKYEIVTDKVHFYTSSIFDTLSLDNGVDSLVLSMDDISNRIEASEFIVNSISGGGQSRKEPPFELIIRKNKLFHVNSKGKADRKKRRGIMNSSKKLKPYYFKIK